MNKTPIIFIPLAAVIFFEKPYFDGKEWHNLMILEEGIQRVFLSETRSTMLKVPINIDEEPVAYVHTIYGQGEECYFPVYDRTNMVELERLYPNELVKI